MSTLDKFTLGSFVHNDPKNKTKARNIDAFILKEIESGRYLCAARPLRMDSLADGFKASGFMQGNIDVHGSHELSIGRGVEGKG